MSLKWGGWGAQQGVGAVGGDVSGIFQGGLPGTGTRNLNYM